MLYLLKSLCLTSVVSVVVFSGCDLFSAEDQPRPAQGHDTSKRWLSLAPSLTEWVYLLGAERSLVARSEHCDQPPEAKHKPSAGSLFPPDLELILSFKPSDVLMIDGHPLFKKQLERLGVNVHTLQPKSLQDLWRVVTELGELLGTQRAAQSWIQDAQRQLSAHLADLKPIPKPAPKVLIEVWPKPLSVAGAESFMGDLVRVVGGAPVPSGRGAWPQLPIEDLVQLNPDVIIVSSPQRVRELLSPELSTAWRSLSAIKHRRVYAREGRLERPDPELITELIWLATLLRAPPHK